MANPVLNENVFRRENVAYSNTGVMTVGGTATKTLLLLLMVVAGAAYSWKLYYNAINPQSITSWMFGGLIVAFIMAMIISFSFHGKTGGGVSSPGNGFIGRRSF